MKIKKKCPRKSSDSHLLTQSLVCFSGCTFAALVVIVVLPKDGGCPFGDYFSQEFIIVWSSH